MTGDQPPGSARADGRRPSVSETTLHSYLVTRHTGRAVRMSIREGIAASTGPVVAVLDFGDVAVIDFSCADEVVAKLVEEVRTGDSVGPTYFFLRGLDDHHRDPVESALIRRTLAMTGESVGGEPMLVGAVDGESRAAWRAVQSLGRAPASEVAHDLGQGVDEVRSLLDRLGRRRLVVPRERHYVSLRRTLDRSGGAGRSGGGADER